MEVPKIDVINIYTVHTVLDSSQISMYDKAKFVNQNISAIENIINYDITSNDFKNIMLQRPIQMFRPLQNSFRKRGDQFILAKSLDIKSKDVPKYIDDLLENFPKLKDTHMTLESMEKIKTYVYRHGTQKQVVKALDYELTSSKDKLKTLYSTLSYNTSGLADYFKRPIHRMTNTTLFALYDVINKHLNNMQTNGDIIEEERLRVSSLALVRIYEIQKNSKFIQAVKRYKKLK